MNKFIINNRSFRKRELGRLRAKKFPKAQRELSCVEQSVLLNGVNNADPTLSIIMNNSDCATSSNSICEQVSEVLNEESVVDILMSHDC